MLPGVDVDDQAADPATDSDEGMPKSEVAYTALREAIIAMQLPPGEPLPEKGICAWLGVSRTPLREAVLRLRSEQLVVVQPGTGTFVNKIVLSEVLQGKFVRQTLEVRIASLAARGYPHELDRKFTDLLFRQREAADHDNVDLSFALDNEFHRLLCRAAGLPRVWEVIRNVTAQLDRIRRQAFLLDGFYMEVLTEHRAMLTAIRALDAAEACRLMESHVDGIMTAIRAVARQSPDMVETGGIDLDAATVF